MRYSSRTKPVNFRRANAETLALLKILALGNREVAAGRIKPIADVVARLRAKRGTA
jgi:hypothetical protein